MAIYECCFRDRMGHVADSDEAAQAFRFDGARHSEMMPSTVWRLAGW